MSGELMSNANAWIAIDHGLSVDLRLAPYTLVLKGDSSLYQAITEDDWVLVLSPTGEIMRAGHVLRLRAGLAEAVLGARPEVLPTAH